MATVRTGLPGLVARYARAFHGTLPAGGHQVASPLGAWLLLALAAPAARGPGRAELAGVLGCGVREAAAAAADLLAAPHPLVAAASAVWGRPRASLRGWLDALPSGVETGGMPSQRQADEWARQRTFGLIDRFPIDLDAGLCLLLATAVATKVSWDCPFERARASELGAGSPWAGRLTRVLRSPAHPGHAAFIAVTPEAGDVAVHVGRARGGLLVASVIAARDVPPGGVLAAAHRVAVARALGGPAGERSLFDMPLGDGPAWTVREEAATAAGGGERCTAVLPAWSARSTSDLGDPALGFAAVGKALGHGDSWLARQAVLARYGRIGFEAGAVSAAGVLLAMMTPPRGRSRVAELRFGHPFAVVAVAADEHAGGAGGAGDADGAGDAGGAGHGPWHGVPVFSAWVSEPGDAGLE